MVEPLALRRTLANAGLLSAPTLVALGFLLLGGKIPLWMFALGASAAYAATSALIATEVIRLGRWETYIGRLLDRGPAASADALPEASPRFLPSLGRYVREAIKRLDGLAAERAVHDAVLGALPDPLLLLDTKRTIVRANAAAEAVFGVDLVERDLSAAVRHPAVIAAVDEVLAGGQSNRSVEYADPGPPVERMFVVEVVRLSVQSATARVIVAFHDLTYAKRSEEMRSDFIANVSHELRTPLASLIGFIETLQGSARSDIEARDRFLAIMGEQASRMNRLVSDLLSLSRIELLEHTPPQDRVDVGTLLKQVVQALEPQAKARRIAIVCDIPEGHHIVGGERDQLAQVFQNLIDNAIRYGRDDMTIAIEVSAGGDGSSATRGSLSIAVKDRGHGIPPEHVPRLTERFYRVDAARSRALGGTGLGLAIVKHIVNRHRGALTIDSVEGKGSTFTVSLPISA